MAAVTICSDFGAPKNKIWHFPNCFNTYFPWSDGTRCHGLSFLNAEGHEPTTNQKNCCFEVSSPLFLCNNNEPFLNPIVMCNEMWILYDNWWWLGWWLYWEETPNHFPKPNLHQKGHGHYLAVSSTTAFWIPMKPLHLRSMFSKLMRCTETCSTCGQHSFLERAQFSTETPDCTAHNQFFKSWTNWAKMFSLICYIHLTSCQLTTTSSSISTIFFRENASTTHSRWKCFPRVHWITRYGIFILQE